VGSGDLSGLPGLPEGEGKPSLRIGNLCCHKEGRDMGDEERIKISPAIRAYSDGDHQKMEIEIELPGVDRKDRASRG
jgi:hypothetical protein